MKYRILGKTDLRVSEVGFGGAGIGHVWGETTDEECLRAVQRALDLGVNFFDVSPVYGQGKAEENLGKALEGRRQEVYVATKVRLSPDDVHDIPSAVRRSLDQSFQRLRTDYVDLLQIHHQVGVQRGQYLAAADPPRYAMLLTLDDCLALAEAFERLRREGKVRYFGITAWNGAPQVLRELMASGPFHTAQVLYNLLNQTAQSPPPAGLDLEDQGQVLPLAQEHNIGVICVRSHAAGALAEQLDRPVKPNSQVAQDYERAQALSFLKKGPFKTLSQVALRFCLDHPAIATVVPGVKNTTEIEEAVACSDLPPLSQEDMQEVQRLYARGFALAR